MGSCKGHLSIRIVGKDFVEPMWGAQREDLATIFPRPPGNEEREIWNQQASLERIKSLWNGKLVENVCVMPSAHLTFYTLWLLFHIFLGRSILWQILSSVKRRKQGERIIHSKEVEANVCCPRDHWMLNGDYKRGPMCLSEEISNSRMSDNGEEELGG